MVMEAYGVFATEQEIREKCDCLSDGTRDQDLVKAAQDFGFTYSRKYTFDIEALKTELGRGRYPIVKVRTRLFQDTPFQNHAIVVVEITDTEVEVLDPALGIRSLTIKQFLEEWAKTRQTTILVE
ncbi:MAG: cysteine peptidase family C39 domain-containing protein [Blastocatellia bacterium]